MILSIDDDVDRSTWCTPLWLAQLLGVFDLDCCSNDRSRIVSQRAFRLDRGQDGLVLAKFVPRDWRVWCNPPYDHGQVIKWVRAYAHTNFAFLLRFDPSTEWFGALWPHVEAVCFMKDRIGFEPPPGAESSSNPYPHALYYRNKKDIPPAVVNASYSVLRQ